MGDRPEAVVPPLRVLVTPSPLRSYSSTPTHHLRPQYGCVSTRCMGDRLDAAVVPLWVLVTRLLSVPTVAPPPASHATVPLHKYPAYGRRVRSCFSSLSARNPSTLRSHNSTPTHHRRPQYHCISTPCMGEGTEAVSVVPLWVQVTRRRSTGSLPSPIPAPPHPPPPAAALCTH